MENHILNSLSLSGIYLVKKKVVRTDRGCIHPIKISGNSGFDWVNYKLFRFPIPSAYRPSNMFAKNTVFPIFTAPISAPSPSHLHIRNLRLSLSLNSYTDTILHHLPHDILQFFSNTYRNTSKYTTWEKKKKISFLATIFKIHVEILRWQ